MPVTHFTGRAASTQVPGGSCTHVMISHTDGFADRCLAARPPEHTKMEEEVWNCPPHFLIILPYTNKFVKPFLRSIWYSN